MMKFTTQTTPKDWGKADGKCRKEEHLPAGRFDE